MKFESSTQILIELHDFTPKYEEENYIILGRLEHLGLNNKRIIHVVPNWAGKYNILDYNKFLDTVLLLQSRGDEVVMHGYSHKRESKKYNSIYEKIIGEWRYNGDAEFLSEEYHKSRQKIISGKKIMSDAGLSVEGFVPPTWNISDEAKRAVIDEGFKYIGLRQGIDGLKYQNKTPILNLEFTANPRIADYLFRAYNEYILGKTNHNTVLRFPIHPQDLLQKTTTEYLFNYLKKLSHIKRTTLNEIADNIVNNANKDISIGKNMFETP